MNIWYTYNKITALIAANMELMPCLCIQTHTHLPIKLLSTTVHCSCISYRWVQQLKAPASKRQLRLQLELSHVVCPNLLLTVTSVSTSCFHLCSALVGFKCGLPIAEVCQQVFRITVHWLYVLLLSADHCYNADITYMPLDVLLLLADNSACADWCCCCYWYNVLMTVNVELL